MRRFFPVAVSALIATSCLCFAQAQTPENKETTTAETKGMPPRGAPTDYQAQAQAGNVTIAAEFMGHAVPKPDGPLSTEDYVVVETGFFSTPGAKLQLSIGDFSLRINGKKTPLSSQPQGFVARSLKDPQWVPPEGAETKKSKGGINTGGQGDSNAPPPPVHVPVELQRAMAQYVRKASLPEGDRALPQAGLIFFQYRGNTKSIRSLELLYEGPAGKATLTLQP